ncbi:MAG: cell division protein FtsZ [Candidatus Nealsonbacteria bacterium RIFCSPLOWO2_12_FULL_39_31]|uniref:Cell division protein FtsZ n=3 Tax=Candidatus Nealsoniibacteriota TaxID=1817911 RepID=A0A1G2ELB3_9BACT|nr:MAG: Cell division protein FtsZ [Parcubacteria group bacterium GW2011_GWA2_38_27]KKQ98348.1 MAG: Cell division protein FtsZ [Parcubacteria group bacterium GW2011_GWC2_39_11]OGZ19732.1 MAG: cell division protein FtsZ [Candidatus Nealsonbacteria bacterium RIFCSPHIGHO2_01_FULL_38_55]OGZ21039.1 MAG: cell division protein FtsZ [Candidatus Nealsonbacteria bacterium RIFCSPHIGHO2_02_FULL_38_75]OGZ22546.1 MAG: cell division protein FtsZ [Candidatus Nealsonbacteria bacterium RIFCSPLOWO2_01_FULL_38_120
MQSNIKIKVVGVGGSGGNAISRMMKCKIKGVELIAVNADGQDLKKAKAHCKIRIGRELTKGLGTGMNPEIGKKAAEEQREEIVQALSGADMVFITCGLGGGCGGGASPVVAGIAKDLGALTLAVVTKPFSFEGLQRAEVAEECRKKLKEKVDTLIVVSNDKLSLILDPEATISNAFWSCDEILRQAVQGISDLIVLPGIINIDFAAVKSIMKDSGSALFGIGTASGHERVKEAVAKALGSPLLGVSCKGAKGVLFNVSGGKDIALAEVDQAAKIITQEVSPEAKIIFGAIQNEKLKKGEIKITVIATGF